MDGAGEGADCISGGCPYGKNPVGRKLSGGEGGCEGFIQGVIFTS